MNGGTDPDRKMRRRWVMNYRCCQAHGGARCRYARHWRTGRKPKGTK